MPLGSAQIHGKIQTDVLKFKSTKNIRINEKLKSVVIGMKQS